MKNLKYLVLGLMIVLSSCGEQQSSLSGYRGGDIDNSANGNRGQNNNGKIILRDVPYKLQGNNRIAPGQTCANTSAAMLLSYKRGFSISPDALTNKYTRKKAQSPTGLADLFRAEGFRANGTYEGSRSQLRKLLDRGIPVVTYIWASNGGHVITVTGYDKDGFYINDPAGLWKGGYKSGNYDSSDRRPHKHYSHQKLANNIMGRDGDVWLAWIE